MKTVLTIAGSDSGGGAGIQADLKTLGAIGVHGMSAITSVTAQNTVGVQGAHHLPPDFIATQIDSCLEDIGAEVAKTGMLATSEIIEVVMEKLKEYELKTVVDPVMVAASGARLLQEEAVEKMKELVSHAYIATPNIPEAKVLTGQDIESIDDMEKAAQRVFDMGARYVVVKGGHLPGQATDIFYDGDNFTRLDRPRLNTENNHGTGCTFSSAIAAYIALGNLPLQAVRQAKEFTYQTIRFAIPIGKGRGPVNHLAPLQREAEKSTVLDALQDALNELKSSTIDFSKLVPEVAMNFGYSLPKAASIKEVAGFPGRIHWVNDQLLTFHSPQFGGSDHIARIILTGLRYYPQIRSCINIKYTPENLEKIEAAGFETASFNRDKEPTAADTMSWGTAKAIKKSKVIPDVIYDTGAVGKEAMIRFLGEEPQEIVEKLTQIFG